jgi:hypothetical protein
MLKDITLKPGTALTCPFCGRAGLTLRFMQVNNPGAQLITLDCDPLHPLHVRDLDGGGGEYPFVTLAVECSHCEEGVGGGIYLSMVLKDGHTRVRWDTDEEPDAA